MGDKVMGDKVVLYAQGWFAGSGMASGSIRQYQDSSVGVAFLRHELADQFTALSTEMERRQKAPPR